MELNMRKLLILSAAAAATAAAGFAAPAMAQERGDFTGVRVEGLVGWDRAQVPNDHADGIAYGVGLGYDFQMGGAVLGIEGEAGDSSAKKCVTGVAAAGDRPCADAGRDLYVGGRVGAAVGAGTLLYAKAGYTNARFDTNYNANLAGVGNVSTRRDLDGVRVGGGIEHKLGSNAYVKAEYRYSNYQDNVDRHQVVAGFGFRF
jgi:outer membrane immunogenic protein